MSRTIHLKKGDRHDKYIPKFNKNIADKYLAQAGDTFTKFEQLQRNKLWLKKVRDNGIDQGILLFDNHDKQEKLEKLNKILTEFSKPQVIDGKLVWNLGGGMNPFLAMYMNSHRYELKKRTWRVRKLIQ